MYRKQDFKEPPLYVEIIFAIIALMIVVALILPAFLGAYIDVKNACLISPK